MRRAEGNTHAKSTTPTGKWLKGVRWALRKNPENLTDRQRLALATVQQTNKRRYRAYLLKKQLRALYHLPDPAAASEHLTAWLAWASRSQLRPFVKLARTQRAAAPASPPPSATARPTAASKARTPKSRCSTTAPSAFTQPTPSSSARPRPARP